MCSETKLQLAKEIVLFLPTLTAVEWKRSVFREKEKKLASEREMLSYVYSMRAGWAYFRKCYLTKDEGAVEIVALGF